MAVKKKDELPLLVKSLENVPIVKKGDYNYFVHPITDGIPFVEPALLEEVADAMAEVGDFSSCDRIVTCEAMGIPLATLLSHKTGVPMVIVRKRRYGFPDEYALTQETGYSRSPLYINGLKKGDRVVFVDDVISTGGTLIPVADAFKKMGVDLVDVIIVFNKHKNLSEIEDRIGVGIKVLLEVDVVDGRVVVRE